MKSLSGSIVIALLLAGCSSSQPMISTRIRPASIESAVRTRSGLTHHETFHYTGSKQTFVVPDGVTQLHVVAVGGLGAVANESAKFPGAYPGRVSALIPVTPQETLYVFVGGNGNGITGGFNGGGNGASLSPLYYHFFDSYGGGGASDVREGNAGLRHRILIAGGGGRQGGADSFPPINRGAGGWGGGTIGGAGKRGRCGGAIMGDALEPRTINKLAAVTVAAAVRRKLVEAEGHTAAVICSMASLDKVVH